MIDFAERYGPWAVIAGGSEGLGLEFAHQVASRGVNLIIGSHDEASLQSARAAIGDAVQVVTVLGDLARDGAARLLEAAADREVGLLIANAAVAPRGDFLDTDPDQLVAAIRVNVEAPVLLARQLGPAMRARGRGGILLVSSLSSLGGTAVFSTYAGTKAFLRVQAEGLWDELREDGVDVLALVPGTMDTPGLRASAPRGGPRPASAAVVAQRALEHLPRGPVLLPMWRDRFAAVLLTRVLGRRRAIRLTGNTTRRMYR